MVILNVVFPVFCVVAIGYFFSRFDRIDLNTLSTIVIKVAAPCLVFSSISAREIVVGEWLTISSSVVTVVLGTGAITFVYLKLTGEKLRGLYLSTMFINSGNMGLPLCMLAFGKQGFDKAIIFFVTSAVMTYSVGIYLAKGEGGLREIFKLPLIYATALGIVCALWHVTLPAMVRHPVDMLGRVAVPLMMFTLGGQLYPARLSHIKHAISCTVIRIGGGFAIASCLILALGLTGFDRKVILLISSMPSAVMGAILAQRYGRNPDVVASAILLSTLTSIFTIPLVLSLLDWGWP